MAGWEIGRAGAFEVTWTLLLAEKSPANVESGRADGAGDGGGAAAARGTGARSRRG